MFGDDINLEINKGFFDGYAVVKLNGQWNLINPKGEFLFDSDVQEIRFISSFCKGYCCITLNNGEKYALDTNLQWHTIEEVLEANPELEIATYVDENTGEKYYQFNLK